MYSEVWHRDRQTATDPIFTCIDFQSRANNESREALTILLADLFALYIKTKIFHWHAAGPGFRGWHLLLAEQADQVLATVNTIGERVRVLGATPIRLIREISCLQQADDNYTGGLLPRNMLAALLQHNRLIAKQIRRTYTLCRARGDFASATLLEDWINEAEGRYWFLFEMHRDDRGQAAYQRKQSQAEVTND